MPSNPTLGYRPSLDGLRGIAITCVFIHHLDVGLTLGGLGVDIFFVLSGFLITTLLLEEYREQGRIDFKQFYLRRAFRLLPALFCFLGAMVIYAAIALPSEVARETVRFAIFAVFYVTNWIFAFFVVSSPLLGHLWSLAIEEQFYFLWPITLSVLLRSRLSRRSILILVTVLIVIVCVHRTALVWSGARLERIYDGTDTRADSILIGCVVAMLVTWGMIRLNRIAVKVCGLLSIAVIAAYLLNLYGIPGKSIYTVGLTVFGLASGLLIVQAMSAPSGLIQKVLEHRLLVFIGKLSYSLYLWHLFAVKLAASFGVMRIPFAVLFAMSLACTSYYLIERPFLKFKARLSDSRRDYEDRGVDLITA